MNGRFSALGIYFTWYTARGISSFILQLYLNSIGLPVVQIGIALGISGASLLVFELTWGFVIDRFGVAKTLPLVAAIAVTTFLYFPSVSTAPQAYVASFFLGMTFPVMVLIGRFLTVGQSESSGWGAGFGVLGAAVSLGFGFGGLLGGADVSASGYGSAFYLSAVLSAVPVILYFAVARDFGRRREADKGKELTDDGPKGFDWRSFITLSVVSIPLFMGAAFYTGLMQLVVTQTPAIGASTGDAALIVSIAPLSNVIFQPLLGWRFAKRAGIFIALGLLLNGGVFLLMTQVTAIPEFYLISLAQGFCFSMVSPLSLSLLMVRTNRRYSGRVMGAYGAAEDVGILAGPVVGAFVWATYGLVPAYLTMAIPLFAIVVVYLLTFPFRRK